jgi:hypothetical protein
VGGMYTPLAYGSGSLIPPLLSSSSSGHRGPPDSGGGPATGRRAVSTQAQGASVWPCAAMRGCVCGEEVCNGITVTTCIVMPRKHTATLHAKVSDF